MGFRSKATVQKSKSIARVTAPPTPKIFSPTGASLIIEGGQLIAGGVLVGPTGAQLVAQGGTVVYGYGGGEPTGASLVIQGGTPLLFPLANLVAWYDTASLSLNDGDAIASWSDISGGGFTLTQVSPSQKPIYKTNIQNGLAIARFTTASNQFMNNLSVSITAQPITIFAVAKATTSAALATILGGAATTPNTAAFGKDTSDQLFVFGGTVASRTGSIAGAFHVFEGTINGASSLAGSDGSVTTGLNANTTNKMGSGIQLGANASSNPFGGDIGEALLFANAMSSANRSIVRQYLGTKWGITVTP